jgi:hypothetical protein
MNCIAPASYTHTRTDATGLSLRKPMNCIAPASYTHTHTEGHLVQAVSDRCPRTMIRRGPPAWSNVTIALFVAALASGCGSGIYPVSGNVVWKDKQPAKELEGSHVVFELPEKKTSARGVIRGDGTFRLTTLKTDDGAAAGEYKVYIVEDQKNANPEGTLLKPAILHSRFANVNTSGLSATVTSGPNEITLIVERASQK